VQFERVEKNQHLGKKLYYTKSDKKSTVNVKKSIAAKTFNISSILSKANYHMKCPEKLRISK